MPAPADSMCAAGLLLGDLALPRRRFTNNATGVPRQRKDRATPCGSKSHFHRMLGITGEDFLPDGVGQGHADCNSGSRALKAKPPRGVTAVVQLLDQTSASIKLTSADAEENY
jgi:hypothetical protein